MSDNPTVPEFMRLQAMRDPQGPIHYEGAALDEDSLTRCIRAADSGDEAALDWLHSLVCEHALTAYAEASDSGRAARADHLLGRWRDQAEALTGPLPADYQVLARRAAVTGALDARHIEYVTITDDASLVDRIADLLARQRLASSKRRR